MLFEMVSAYNVLLLLMSMVHALRIMSIAHEGLTNIHEAEFVNCYAQNFKATTKEQGDIIDNLMYLKSTYICKLGVNIFILKNLMFAYIQLHIKCSVPVDTKESLIISLRDLGTALFTIKLDH